MLSGSAADDPRWWVQKTFSRVLEPRNPTLKRFVQVNIQRNTRRLKASYVVARKESAAYLSEGFILARILIADDSESMRRALKTFVALNPEWTVCGEVGDANEAIAKAKELHPDVIIMDYKCRVPTAWWRRTAYLEPYRIFQS